MAPASSSKSLASLLGSCSRQGSEAISFDDRVRLRVPGADITGYSFERATLSRKASAQQAFSYPAFTMANTTASGTAAAFNCFMASIEVSNTQGPALILATMMPTENPAPKIPTTPWFPKGGTAFRLTCMHWSTDWYQNRAGRSGKAGEGRRICMAGARS
jgi:hypothetical protein